MNLNLKSLLNDWLDSYYLSSDFLIFLHFYLTGKISYCLVHYSQFVEAFTWNSNQQMKLINPVHLLDGDFFIWAMTLWYFSSSVYSILQTHMCSHPVGLDVWFLVGPLAYFHTLCVRTAMALVRLRGCAGSPEPSLVAYVISTIISRAGSFKN